jgi:hypothetical protein
VETPGFDRLAVLFSSAIIARRKAMATRCARARIARFAKWFGLQKNWRKTQEKLRFPD